MQDYNKNIDEILKTILLNNILLKIEGNKYKEGNFISFNYNFFSLNLLLKNKTKNKTDILKLPLPFDMYKKDDLIYFDYKIKTFIKNNNLEELITKIKKPCVSRFYDRILTIQTL
jgi:hypothetical protein